MAEPILIDSIELDRKRVAALRKLFKRPEWQDLEALLSARVFLQAEELFALSPPESAIPAVWRSGFGAGLKWILGVAGYISEIKDEEEEGK